jgi:hypothetical protein
MSRYRHVGDKGKRMYSVSAVLYPPEWTPKTH